VQVGDRLRVLLDDYQFAGNDHLIFTNDTGSLFSTPTDGSAPKILLAPTLGVTEHADLPVDVPWLVLAEGSRVFFVDPAGTHMTNPDGSNPLPIDTYASLPYCHYDVGAWTRCAVSTDGKSVLMTSSAPGTFMGKGGKVQPATSSQPGCRFKVLTLGETPTLSRPSPSRCSLSRQRVRYFWTFRLIGSRPICAGASAKSRAPG